jgi:glycerol-3-phosphate dehydrogenase (NAD(P)+)
MPLADIIASTKQVVEGVTSSKSVMELARAHSVEMPITDVIAAVVYDGLEIGEAAVMLASRTAKPERYG